MNPVHWYFIHYNRCFNSIIRYCCIICIIIYSVDKEPASKNASEAHLPSDQGDGHGDQLHGGQVQGDKQVPYQQKETGPTDLSDAISLAENIENNETADVDEAIIKLGGSG